MGEALITSRGGESDIAVGLPHSDHGFKDADRIVDSSVNTISFDFSNRPITNRFVGYVRFGGCAFFTALNKKAVFQHEGSTITAWFELSDTRVICNMTSTPGKTMNLIVSCGFY